MYGLDDQMISDFQRSATCKHHRDLLSTVYSTYALQSAELRTTNNQLLL
jgi:hypothetical protein